MLRLCCAGCSLQSNPAFVTADKNIAAKRRKFKNDHLNPLIEDREKLIFNIYQRFLKNTTLFRI